MDKVGIHMFTHGPATLSNHVNISEAFHELRGQKDTNHDIEIPHH